MDNLLDQVLAGAGKYDTPLSPKEEMVFQRWKNLYAPNDSGMDYDLRGAFKAGLTPDAQTGHWPDTFKKPNHPTFSTESQYAPLAPEKAGVWIGDKFVPPLSTGDPRIAKAKTDSNETFPYPAQPEYGDTPLEQYIDPVANPGKGPTGTILPISGPLMPSEYKRFSEEAYV